MTKPLSQYISLNRRYARSINLERDFESLEALEGYILTERSLDALQRIIQGIEFSQSPRAWTLTSVYGTGKSAFAQFLTSLLADSKSKIRLKALDIARQILTEQSIEYQTLHNTIPESGYLRAIATAQREPISHTLIRALSNGVDSYWKPSQQQKIPVITKLVDLKTQIQTGGTVSNLDIAKIVSELAEASKSGIFIIIDELGKSLEYATYNQGAEDLYLLQQLSELQQHNTTPIYILGILHQAFADYSQRLATIQRNEWAKIQGRFEDIPFTESPSVMVRLIGQVIDKRQADAFECAIHHTASEWLSNLQNVIQGDEITVKIIESIYPLHPITSLVLPILCQRYAQNDRSLFTFLTSSEPLSLKTFLHETNIDSEPFPTLKLDRLYDYFIQASGIGLASRPHLQRWVEIQDLISDSQGLDPDSLRLLKTIGILNLITTTGTNRATRELVTLAMCDSPRYNEQRDYWGNLIDKLLKKGIITHRRQVDELRIWQGSDFNVDIAVNLEIEQERGSLVNLLTALRPLNPVIAQRHSYTTGTLRYFERRYFDNNEALELLQLEDKDSDGLIGYWLDEIKPTRIPAHTADGKPFLLLMGNKLDILRIRTREYAALKKIQVLSPELQTDGVARKEVRYRITEAEQLLDDILIQAFYFYETVNPCWVQGIPCQINSVTEFNNTLSQVCDEVYHQTPILWNELINRRQLTAQGTKARRELITAMIEHSELEMLGLSGYGPEVTMYYSLLKETGIHLPIPECDLEGNIASQPWGIYPPQTTSKIYSFWRAVEDFCLSAYDKPHTLDLLYEKLNQPPYGIKQGAIPVLIAAVILYHLDDVGVYHNGTFIPVLGAQHFELLVKDPSRFAVKYFEIVGLRSEVFKELESILLQAGSRKTVKLRNTTLLRVVTPLYQFVKRLPAYTKQTQELSKESLGVLKALQETLEPDELLFTQLPVACNLAPIGTIEADDSTIAKTLKTRLVKALQEINSAYENLLTRCQSLLSDAFRIRSNDITLREDLQLRAKTLAEKCVERNLRSFVQIAIDKDKSDQEWLEAVLMVIGDKPPSSWTDEIVTGFEGKLADIARRFKNLEALQEKITSTPEGLEARRITVTRSDGEETHQMVWVDKRNSEEIEKYVEKILDILPNDENFRQAVLTKLTEILLNPNSNV